MRSSGRYPRNTGLHNDAIQQRKGLRVRTFRFENEQKLCVRARVCVCFINNYYLDLVDIACIKHKSNPAIARDLSSSFTYVFYQGVYHYLCLVVGLFCFNDYVLSNTKKP